MPEQNDAKNDEESYGQCGIRNNPSQKFKAVRGGFHYRGHSPGFTKPLQNLFVVVNRLQAGDLAGVAGSWHAAGGTGERVQFADHAVGVRAAYVVALEQHLSAAAGTHNLAAQPLEAGLFGVSPHQQNDGATEKKDFSHTARHFLTPAGCQLPGSPPAATVTAVVGTVAFTALGTSARLVPKTRMNTPSHTKETSGLTKALIVGRSGFPPA